MKDTPVQRKVAAVSKARRRTHLDEAVAALRRASQVGGHEEIIMAYGMVRQLFIRYGGPSAKYDVDP